MSGERFSDGAMQSGRSPPVQHRPREHYTPLAQPGPYVVQAGPIEGGDNISFAGSVPPSPAKHDREQLHRFAGLGVGLASVAAEHVLSHPCIVLRRQCQVHHDSIWYHLTPFTLFQPIFNIQRHQSVTTLWKGLGSTLMVKGMCIACETSISEFTPLPREVSKHSSMKKMAQHILLKALSCAAVTPFFAASLTETVQSEIASERPGVFDCLKDGVSRLMSLTTPQSTRLLPVWKLVVPCVAYGVLHYVIFSMTQYTVNVSTKTEMLESKGTKDEGSSGQMLMATYYPELIATFSGNLLADSLLFPLETVLHRLFLQGTRTIIDNTDTGLGVLPIITRYEGVVDCFRSVIIDEGVSGLFKGFGALVLQYTLHAAILKMTRVLFEFVSQEDVVPAMLTPGTSPSRYVPDPNAGTPRRYIDAESPRRLHGEYEQRYARTDAAYP